MSEPVISSTNLLNPNAWNSACPANSFWNTQTGQCETLSVGTPPPPVPVQGWGFWQWAALIAGIGVAGLLAFDAYKHRRQWDD